jgi:hypothetical protein
VEQAAAAEIFKRSNSYRKLQASLARGLFHLLLLVPTRKKRRRRRPLVLRLIKVGIDIGFLASFTLSAWGGRFFLNLSLRINK